MVECAPFVRAFSRHTSRSSGSVLLTPSTLSLTALPADLAPKFVTALAEASQTPLN